MQKIIPIFIEKNGDNIINSIVGVNTNRIHNDIKVRYVEGRLLTVIEYYPDPAKSGTDILLTPEEPVAVYSQLDHSFDVLRVILPLVGGGTVSIPTEDIIYCYLDPATYERCSIDAIVRGRRTLYKLNMTFMELLTEINSPQAVYWDDEKFPFTRDKQGQSSKPDFDFTNLGLLFPQNDATEIVYLIGQFSHTRKNGSDIYPHVHFIQSNALTPVFKMDYRWYKNGAAPPASFTTLIANDFVFTYTSGSILQVVNFPIIDGSGANEISFFLDIKIYRDDNNAIGDVLTKEFDLHYTKDSFGSVERWTK